MKESENDQQLRFFATNRAEIDRQLKFYIRHSLDWNLTVRELEAFYAYLANPTDATKQVWVRERLLREADKYRSKGIPRHKWPRPLQAFSDEEINNRREVVWRGNGHSSSDNIQDETKILNEEALGDRRR